MFPHAHGNLRGRKETAQRTRGVELIDEEEYIVSFMFVFSFVNFRLID